MLLVGYRLFILSHSFTQEVDLMVGAISIQADREMAMDFTHPFYYDSSTIMMRRPHEDEAKIYTLMKPFKYQVYLILAIVLPASAIMLSLMERASPYYRLHGREGRQSFQSSFWYMFGAILSQGEGLLIACHYNPYVRFASVLFIIKTKDSIKYR